MASERIHKIKYAHRDLGFLRASLEGDTRFAGGWRLSVESPAELDEFREHLASGACMTLALLGGDGEWRSGEGCVANVSASEAPDEATVVTLSGQGPLRRI